MRMIGVEGDDCMVWISLVKMGNITSGEESRRIVP
jgi:hypothetical protein